VDIRRGIVYKLRRVIDTALEMTVPGVMLDEGKL
jgi:hypothetical protein